MRPKERDRLKEYCLENLRHFTRKKERNIFFINALGGLDGRLEKNPTMLQESGMLSVESELKRFLASERGRVKLVRPTTEIKAAIREARRAIPEREKLLHTNLDTIQQRYEVAKDRLNEIEKQRKFIFGWMIGFRADVRQEITSEASSFYRNMTAQVQGWASNYQLQEPMKLIEVFNKKAQERVVQETLSYLTNKVAEESQTWQKQTLQPLLDRRFQEMITYLDQRATQFINELDQVREDLTADPTITISQETVKREKIGALERILAATTGFLMFDIGSAALGATFGFKEMIKSALPQILLAVGTVVLFGWNPFILIPALLLSAGVQGVFKMKSTNQQIKEAIGKVFEEKMRDSRAENAREIADKLDI